MQSDSTLNYLFKCNQDTKILKWPSPHQTALHPIPYNNLNEAIPLKQMDWICIISGYWLQKSTKKDTY